MAQIVVTSIIINLGSANDEAMPAHAIQLRYHAGRWEAEGGVFPRFLALELAISQAIKDHVPRGTGQRRPVPMMGPDPTEEIKP